jgi:hypothetical protein
LIFKACCSNFFLSHRLSFPFFVSGML